MESHDSSSMMMASNNNTKQKKKKNENNSDDIIILGNNHHHHLPSEIVSHIFHMLPIESLLQCRRVCSTWRLIIADPVFRKTFVDNSTAVDDDSMGFIASIHDDNQPLRAGRYYALPTKEITLPCGDYYIGSSSSKDIVKKKSSIGSIIGSCNGLICSLFNAHIDLATSSCALDIIVMNPSTGECAKLPRVCMDDSGRSAWGFGCHPSTNEYMVVGVNCYTSKGQYVKVYTLGSNGAWRVVGLMKNPPEHILGYFYGVLLHGSLHWRGRAEGGPTIVSFDLGEEEFTNIPYSLEIPGVHSRNYELGVLGKSLCLSSQNEQSRITDIWLLEKNSSWTNKFNLRWQMPRYQQYKPIALSETGKILLLCESVLLNSLIMASYDLKTEKLERIRNFEDTEVVTQKGWRSNLRVRVIPHSKGLVSLKALGEVALI